MYSCGSFPLEVKASRDFLKPNDYNGGSVVAIAGDDFAVIGADTRFSPKEIVVTRETNRLIHLGNKSVLGSYGCLNNMIDFANVVKMRVAMYKTDHDFTISLASVAQIVSELMYSRRLMPIFTNNILVGLDAQGKGHVYSFDPIGHYDSTEYGACGSFGIMIAQVLDKEFANKNRAVDPNDVPKITKDKAIDLISEAFATVGQRDEIIIDSLIIKEITRDGINEFHKKLRKD